MANWSVKYEMKDVDERNVATRLVGFTISKLSTKRRNIFKYHLELINALLKGWQGKLTIFDVIIDDLLRNADVEETDKEIHVFSLLLHNDVFIFDKDIVDRFLKFAMKRLNCSKKAIYGPCSEMLGLFMLKSKERNEQIESFVDDLWKNDIYKTGNVLEGISIHFSEFLKEKHVVRMLSRLGTSIPNVQYVFLKVLLNAETSKLKTVHEFRDEKWDKYIDSQSTEVQIVTLSLVKKNLSILREGPIFRSVISAVCKATTNPFDLTKKLATDIVMEIYGCPGKFSMVSDLCKNVLIDGLASDNPDVSRTVRDFWMSQNMLPDKLPQRFIKCFSVYKPNIEDDLLGIGVQFLLGPLKESPDYDKPIFDHPLEDFTDEELQYSKECSATTTQHPYEAPMFADTFIEATGEYLDVKNSIFVKNKRG